MNCDAREQQKEFLTQKQDEAAGLLRSEAAGKAAGLEDDDKLLAALRRGQGTNILQRRLVDASADDEQAKKWRGVV